MDRSPSSCPYLELDAVYEKLDEDRANNGIVSLYDVDEVGLTYWQRTDSWPDRPSQIESLPLPVRK